MNQNTKKLLLKIILVLLILLNIFDFLNYLPGDIDMINKLLSWGMMAYLFYYASITKIFIGIKKKAYDIGFILAYFLFTVPKTILLHLENLKVKGESLTGDTFLIFGKLLQHIQEFEKAHPGIILQYTFFIGILATIILSIGLLLNNRPEKKSFIGSLNLQESWTKYAIEQITLIFFSIFFGLIIFNLFMEWFALSVNSLILVIALFYYLIKYIKTHTNSKVAKYLNEVSNAGNDFFVNVIERFSDKKTFFTAIALILSLHLLVDAGVYLVSYTTGVENELYFNALATTSRDHTPLIDLYSITNPNNSQLAYDISKTKTDIFLLTTIILIYILNLFTFTFLLLFPFYFLYTHFQEKQINLKKWINILFLISIITYSFLFALPTLSKTLTQNQDNTLSNPLNLALPKENIRGVDIYTNSIISKNTSGEHTSWTYYELLILISLILITTITLTLKYNKYTNYFEKISYTLILLFFIFYIGMFFISSVSNEYSNLKQDITSSYGNPEYLKLELNLDTKTIKTLDNITYNLNDIGKISVSGKIFSNQTLDKLKEALKNNTDYSLFLYLEFDTSNKKQIELKNFENPKNAILKYTTQPIENPKIIYKLDTQKIILYEKIYAKNISISNPELQTILIPGNKKTIDTNLATKYLLYEENYKKYVKPEKIYNYNYLNNILEITPLSTLPNEKEQKEFLKIDIISKINNEPITQLELKDYTPIYFAESNNSFYIDLGEKYYETLSTLELKSKTNENINIQNFITTETLGKNTDNIDNDNNNKIIKIEGINLSKIIYMKLQKIIEILRLVFTSVFYIFGTLAFTIYFIRELLLRKTKEN